MQDHPLAVEAKFSKIFYDTSMKLSNSYPSIRPCSDSSASNSLLGNIATMATAAINNSSLQGDIAPLVEAAQSPSLASTLPTSNYFDNEHFVSLTLIDLAINVSTISISKTLLEMAQSRLPLLRSVFSSTNSSNSATNTKSASSINGYTPKIKTLNETINNYMQLSNVPMVTSLEDLLLDVTIPLEGAKATKMIQYYKRIEEHCCQHYISVQNMVSIDEQVKMTADFFETDPQAKINLISFIR